MLLMGPSGMLSLSCARNYFVHLAKRKCTSYLKSFDNEMIRGLKPGKIRQYKNAGEGCPKNGNGDFPLDADAYSQFVRS